jgi:protein TonB
MLDRAAVAAVRGWHFLPAVRDGRPVSAWVEIPVRFHLR